MWFSLWCQAPEGIDSSNKEADDSEKESEKEEALTSSESRKCFILASDLFRTVFKCYFFMTVYSIIFRVEIYWK